MYLSGEKRLAEMLDINVHAMACNWLLKRCLAAACDVHPIFLWLKMFILLFIDVTSSKFKP